MKLIPVPRKSELYRDGECVAAELGALKAKTGHRSEMCFMMTLSKRLVDIWDLWKRDL